MFKIGDRVVLKRAPLIHVKFISSNLYSGLSGIFTITRLGSTPSRHLISGVINGSDVDRWVDVSVLELDKQWYRDKKINQVLDV